MSSVKRLLVNTGSMFVAQGIQPFLTIFLVFVIGRTLGPEVFGKYTVIFQIFSIFQITCSFGLKTLLTREIANKKDNTTANKYLINGLLLGIPASILNIGIVAAVVILLNYDYDITVGTYLIAISLLASSMTDIFSGILSGYEEVKKIAYSWITFLAIKTIISIAVLLLGYGLFVLILVHVITKFVQTIIVYWYVFKLIGKPKLEIDLPCVKDLFQMGWSLALLAVFVSLFWRIDAIMLSKMVSDEAVGNYGAAYRIFHFLLMTIRSFSLAFFPMISSMVDNKKHFRRACRKSIRYITILVLPLVILAIFFAPKIMPLIWGDKFDNNAVSLVFQVMMLSILPFAFSEIFGSALIASRNQKVHVTVKSLALFLKIILNYYLTLKYGIVGPAISTAIAIVVLLILQLPFIIPKLLIFKINSLVLPFFKISIATTSMIIAIKLLDTQHFLIGMATAGVTYFAFLFILKIISPEDKAYFNKLIKKQPDKFLFQMNLIFRL